MKIKAVLAILVACLVLFAATAPPTLIVPYTTGLTPVEINWAAVPATNTRVCSETIWLEQIVFSNGGTARTITATDAQSVPVEWMTAVPLTANQVTAMVFPMGMRLQGGFSIAASNTGVTFQYRGKVKR